MQPDIHFQTVLDIGCGIGQHTKAFKEAGYDVTPIDHVSQFHGVHVMEYGNNKSLLDKNTASLELGLGNEYFDLIWCSHCLEHQRNVGAFLDCIYWDLKLGGWLAVTVPPMKNEIVGGHVSLWNAGLLLYNLILAGFDCSQAKVKTYGYNCSVIVQKVPVELPNNLHYNKNDIEKLKPWFPNFFYHGVNGDIKEWNWQTK
jgi:SAM-dependent methyltransferase